MHTSLFDVSSVSDCESFLARKFPIHAKILNDKADQGAKNEETRIASPYEKSSSACRYTAIIAIAIALIFKICFTRKTRKTKARAPIRPEAKNVEQKHHTSQEARNVKDGFFQKRADSPLK
jgi:hypothetical protein